MNFNQFRVGMLITAVFVGLTVELATYNMWAAILAVLSIVAALLTTFLLFEQLEDKTIDIKALINFKTEQLERRISNIEAILDKKES